MKLRALPKKQRNKIYREAIVELRCTLLRSRKMYGRYYSDFHHKGLCCVLQKLTPPLEKKRKLTIGNILILCELLPEFRYFMEFFSSGSSTEVKLSRYRWKVNKFGYYKRVETLKKFIKLTE